MATPDGIEAEDWDHVRELAIGVLDSCSDPVEEKESRGDLLAYLDRLERKYGALPSILATRADYVDDDCLKEELLQTAYDLAIEMDDAMNCMLIAHSLAEFYIEKLIDVDEGKRWLHRLHAHLLPEDEDSWFSNEAKTLRGKLESLIPDP